jgi:hypothetical protein
VRFATPCAPARWRRTSSSRKRRAPCTSRISHQTGRRATSSSRNQPARPPIRCGRSPLFHSVCHAVWASHTLEMLRDLVAHCRPRLRGSTRTPGGVTQPLIPGGAGRQG